jgi:hypothetical protein
LLHHFDITIKNPMKKLTSACAVLLLAVTNQFAHAAPITYLINRVIPQQSSGYGDATVTGYITTNGTLGFISSSDITSFDIQTTVVGRLETRQSGHMTSSNSYLSMYGLGLEATSNTLNFDFIPGRPSFQIRDVFAGTTDSGWSVSFNPLGRFDESIYARVFGVNDYTAAPAGFVYTKAELATTSGRQTQGALSAPSAVPLPTSALLIAIGLGAFYRRGGKTN